MPDRGRAAAGVVVAVLAVGSFACAGQTKKPAPLPPVSEVQAQPIPSKVVEEPVAAPLPPTVVVIDEGGAAPEGPRSLAQAAEAERRRRAEASRPVVVLDDKNLAAYGKDQKLTIASAAPSPAGKEAREIVASATKDETYWRERGLDIRRRWHDADERVTELQGRAEGLRRRFYAADDPYLRDTQIKPEWDQALDELDRSRREAELCQNELETFLNEGRVAGALPGWMREGTELEPEGRSLKAPTAEPTEPVIVAEPPADPS